MDIDNVGLNDAYSFFNDMSKDDGLGEEAEFKTFISNDSGARRRQISAANPDFDAAARSKLVDVINQRYFSGSGEDNGYFQSIKTSLLGGRAGRVGEVPGRSLTKREITTALNASRDYCLKLQGTLHADILRLGANAYGNGFREGFDGGAGYMGLIGDEVVKFGTHGEEVPASVSALVSGASERLRHKLVQMLNVTIAQLERRTTPNVSLELEIGNLRAIATRLASEAEHAQPISRTGVASIIKQLIEAMGRIPGNESVVSVFKGQIESLAPRFSTNKIGNTVAHFVAKANAYEEGLKLLAGRVPVRGADLAAGQPYIDVYRKAGRDLGQKKFAEALLPKDKFNDVNTLNAKEKAALKDNIRYARFVGVLNGINAMVGRFCKENESLDSKLPEFFGAGKGRELRKIGKSLIWQTYTVTESGNYYGVSEEQCHKHLMRLVKHFATLAGSVEGKGEDGNYCRAAARCLCSKIVDFLMRADYQEFKLDAGDWIKDNSPFGFFDETISFGEAPQAGDGMVLGPDESMSVESVGQLLEGDQPNDVDRGDENRNVGENTVVTETLIEKEEEEEEIVKNHAEVPANAQVNQEAGVRYVNTSDNIGFSEFAAIVSEDDDGWKNDDVVYYLDEKRNQFGSGKDESVKNRSAEDIQVESGTMRANLLKEACKQLNIKANGESRVKDRPVSEATKQAFQEIKRILLNEGRYWEEGSRVTGTPLTKGDISKVVNLVKGAKAPVNQLIEEEPNAGAVNGVKRTVGVPKASELSEEQKAFLAEEDKAYRDWYEDFLVNGTDSLKYASLKWKLDRALDTRYQERVCQLFGNLLKPVQGDGELEAAVPSTQKSVDAWGGIQKSARTLVKNDPQLKDLTFGYQIAADATYCGGTLTSTGQEEAMFIDMSAMNLAYLLHEGYVELYDSTTEEVLSADEFKGRYGGSARLRYALDENGERKIKTWLGMAMPTYIMTTDGVPNEGGVPVMSWFIFTAATAFGYGRANIDRGGFIEAVANRPKKRLDKNNKVMRARVDAFFTLINAECEKVENDDEHFLNGRRKFGYGAATGGKMWNELMVLATFYTGDKFDIFGEDPTKEFGRLMDLVRRGNYEAELEEAKANYQATSFLQNRLWRQLERKLGLDAVAHTNPGGTFFANSQEVTLTGEGGSVQTDGGHLLHLHLGYSDNEESKVVAKAAKREWHDVEKAEA